ncbi:hypothetical protein B9Z55_028173 [Caenorhabditis nigoni]|uniref:Uncharacterized protein n=2 Tax=Caenorhabditis nigoni TaxID=1611254 RepID=A0A2G5SD10_9PELO|nr:hypothetical protein B9Z55_028173 [Caenorhabditis nigoni]
MYEMVDSMFRLIHQNNMLKDRSREIKNKHNQDRRTMRMKNLEDGDKMEDVKHDSLTSIVVLWKFCVAQRFTTSHILFRESKSEIHKNTHLQCTWKPKAKEELSCSMSNFLDNNVKAN